MAIVLNNVFIITCILYGNKIFRLSSEVKLVASLNSDLHNLPLNLIPSTPLYMYERINQLKTRKKAT